MVQRQRFSLNQIWHRFFTNVEATNQDIKCNTLSGNVLTQINNLITTSAYTKKPNRK